MVTRLVMRDGCWLRWTCDDGWYIVGEYDAGGRVATLFLRRKSLREYVRCFRERHSRLPLWEPLLW